MHYIDHPEVSIVIVFYDSRSHKIVYYLLEENNGSFKSSYPVALDKF